MVMFEKYGKMFNFGARTGIELPDEKSGILPDKAWLDTNYKEKVSIRGAWLTLVLVKEKFSLHLCKGCLYFCYANKGTIYHLT